MFTRLVALMIMLAFSVPFATLAQRNSVPIEISNVSLQYFVAVAVWGK